MIREFSEWVTGKIAILITEVRKISCHILIALADTSLFPKYTVYFLKRLGDNSPLLLLYSPWYVLAQGWTEYE